MPVEPHDPRLTALLLGELSERERAALEAKLAHQPELAESLQGSRETAATLRQELAAEPCPQLTAAQRESVLGEIASAGSEGGTSASGTWGALLASIGWGSWGVWLALAATVLLLAAGTAVWHLRDASRQAASSDSGQSQTSRRVKPESNDRHVGIRAVQPAVAEPPLITLRVGESLPLRVLGRVNHGREASLAADRLTWSTEPLVGFVEFDTGTLMLTGLKATPQPLRLTVRLGDLKAEARVRVIRATPPGKAVSPGKSDGSTGSME